MSGNYEYHETTHEIHTKTEFEYNPVPGGLGKFYFDRLKELALDENLIAQIDAGTETKQSFKQLLESSVRLAQYMRDNGIQSGDNITMCSYNHPNTTLVILASQFIGAIPSCTDPILSLEDTKHLLNLINPKIVFVSEGSEDLIKTALDFHKLSAKIISVTLEHHEEYETIEGILKQTSVEIDSFETVFIQDVSETCTILFSSGTTGLPKGICLPHTYFLCYAARSPRTIIKAVLLTYSSYYWISAVYFLVLSVHLGMTRVLCKTFDKETTWDIFHKYRVMFSLLSNTYAMEASAYLTKDKAEKLEGLMMFGIGGGPIPDKYLYFYQDMLQASVVSTAYALTEAGFVAQYKKGDKFTSSGSLILNGQTIKVVDPDTEENLPLNKIGEIRVKFAHQMNGYYKMDSKNAWDDHGFLKTGDLGYIDEGFNLFIVDRIKEMFKYRSWHVVPTKIENLLLTHPAVLYAVVFGKPTYNEDENHAMAVVCLNTGSGITAKDLEAFVNDKMDDINKIRAGVHIVDQNVLEITPSGKINRRTLKGKFLK